MGINTADNLSLGSLFVHLFKSLFFYLIFFFSFMGRMNFPVLLGLLLSAVMVTGRGIKDHIASERKHQADAAAAEPEKAEEAIVDGEVAWSIKNHRLKMVNDLGPSDRRRGQPVNDPWLYAIKNIQADQVADEAADEPEADKTPTSSNETASKQPANRTRLATDECETYPQNACANGVAYGCHKNKLYGGKWICWLPMADGRSRRSHNQDQISPVRPDQTCR